METTTDLKELKKGARFTWGIAITIHDVGPYNLVEYHPWIVEGCSVKTGRPNDKQISFHGYINQKSIGQSWDSLDAALAGCIAYRHEGPNSRAGGYFIKMISETTNENNLPQV